MRLRTVFQGLAAATLITAALPAFAQNVDGTTGNPPGTAASRALDRAAGTNTSGAYPAQSDGTPANPSGTAAGRATDRAVEGTRRATNNATESTRRATTNHGTTTHRSTTQHSGSAANPPGTAASRTLDRAAGTNTSGAYPAQSDGTPANPSGTAASRALGTTNR